MYENKTNDKIFAEALTRILENQIEIKRHIGLVREDGYYGDCYYDNQIMDDLRNVD